MLIEEYKHQIAQALAFPPTTDQARAIDCFANFMADRSANAVMILRGSAGTGKTALASGFVSAMRRMKIHTVLLAPTGRAAKVFSLNAGANASTIHRCIYREKTFNGTEGEFSLNFNKHRDTLFIVDEASMINVASSSGTFGSGNLLGDLIRFVYEGNNCRLLLIGDKAQLPPVGEDDSPALMGYVLEEYHLRPHECDLDEVLRQSETSGILWNATLLRRMIENPMESCKASVWLGQFADIKKLSGSDLIEALSESYHHVGRDETMVITRSNKRANVYNQGIRRTILEHEEELSTGDWLMVVKNKYLKKNTTANASATKLDFIANGDRAVVRRVRNFQTYYGLRFADATLSFPDYDQAEIETTVVLDTLTADTPALTREQNEQLFQGVWADYADLTRKTDRIKRLREDKYYNAMQIKFGYAITCHKAQGGQWAHVYIDQGYMTEEMYNADYLHWLYTAFTRASERLYLVNWPAEQVSGTVDD